MASNITEQQYSAGLQLSEPHFEEEATLLSARPVVPLHEIEAAKRSRKRLTFGLALVTALVVGALGATLIYRQRGQAPETATVETGTVETALADASETAAGVSTAATAGGGKSEAPAPTVSASVPVRDKVRDEAAEKPRDNAAARSRKPAPQSARPTKSSDPWRDQEVDRMEAQWAERRAERREARRLRREAQRESGGEVRGRRVRRSDDLLRIREIFEGPPRP